MKILLLLLKIEYFVEETPLGNAGALFRLKDKLTEDFLLLNADSIFNIDFNRLIKYHYEKKALITLFTHPNSHPYDSGLLITDDSNRVTKWITKEETRPTYYKNRVNAGVHVVSPEIFNLLNIDSEKIDLDRQIIKPLLETGKVFAYDSPEYVKDMGTPDRFETVKKEFLSGKVKRRTLASKQKAIFLDRDGTINKYVGFLRNIDDFELLTGVSEAIKRINESDYLAIVVSNQPVIARGEVTFEELNEIHNKMETLLGKDGTYLDAIYYCPHHPDKGFKGERVEFKIDCDCRKPKPGMLLKAAKDFNIDLSKSWMIGDGENDVIAGKAAGCNTILLSKDSCDTMSENKANDLLEAIRIILK